MLYKLLTNGVDGLFINDLAVQMKQLNVGVDIDGETLCCLLYADDIVIISEEESEMDIMLSQLSDWCSK